MACAPSTIEMMPRDAAQLAQFLDREELTGLIGDVAEVHHLGLRHDGAGQPAEQILAARRHGEVDARQLDLVAAHPLVPGRQHASVVLLGREDLVAGLQVDAVLRDLERLAGIARDGNFFGIGAELGGEAAAGRLDVALGHAPVIHRRLVGPVVVALAGLVHHRRGRAGVAVVEVDDGPVEGEGELNLAPVVLVGRHLRGRPAARRRLPCEGRHLVDTVAGGGQAGASGAASETQEGSTASHGQALRADDRRAV